ncbi:hypothetical protein LP414_30075 [Polaromonas sp. P1(28)-13]|nr:hypothetical protein LP414_30075 [Polaromonas sp. P1(28)-13]
MGAYAAGAGVITYDVVRAGEHHTLGHRLRAGLEHVEGAANIAVDLGFDVGIGGAAGQVDDAAHTLHGATQ